MRKLAESRPLFFSILIVLAAELIMSGTGALLKRTSFPPLATMLLGEACFCAFVAWLLTGLGWWREAGYRSRVTGRALLAFSPWLLLVLLMAAEDGTRSAGAPMVAATAVFTLMIGFAEEGLLRGVSLTALLPGGPVRAAVLSSLVFGLAHVLNVLQGRDVASSLVQAVYATFIGIGFAGCRLYGGTIWPAIVVHALIDFADLAGRDLERLREPGPTTVASAVAPIVITGLYALYGLWLVRRYRRRTPEAGRPVADALA